MKKKVLGVIGGSGVYNIKGVELVREHDVVTPFGSPSDAILETQVGGKTVFFLPRHGRDHRFTPSEIPFRANIFALKKLGVTHLIGVTAVGIMEEGILPGDLVIPDQLFDRTRGFRENTFFGNGLVGHVAFADPYCRELSAQVHKAAVDLDLRVHLGGAYLCMEGPRFSTRSESHFYRATMRPRVIGMTAAPEVGLAREAEIAYAALALATDFDCWHESEEAVSVEAVIAVLRANAERANRTLLAVAERFNDTWTCSCHQAAAGAIMTHPDKIPAGIKAAFEPLFGHYFSGAHA